jgi:hypothetical protein
MRNGSTLLMAGILGLGLAGCGGGEGSLSFQDMCDQGAAAMCGKASSCGSSQSKADCIAQAKAQNCVGGVEQYCGVGMTFQSSKASACLDALEALTCTELDTMPTACGPEALCGSQGGSTPVGTPGEACHALSGDPNSCDPKASLCYAAGKSSSCPGKAACVGDITGMTCAAPCTADADCLSAGAGLVCLQDCTVIILNGFCVTPKAKAKLVQYTCSDARSADAAGMSGWSL